MARARLLKPGFFKDEELADVRPPDSVTTTPAAAFAARLTFEGLWTLADRAGRLEDRPRWIKGELFPYDEVDIEPILTALAEAGFITRYTSKGGSYIWVNRFQKHQSPHIKEPDSTIPAPGRHGASIRLDSSTGPAPGPHQSSPSESESVPVPESETESESLSGVGEGQEINRGTQQGLRVVDRVLADEKKKGVSRRFRGRL